MVFSRRLPKDVKFCMAEFGDMMQYDEEARAVKGMFAKQGNYILSMIRNIVNYTIVKSNEENKLINSETGEYSGCFGKLQRGEADAAAYPTVMPLIGITNITQLNATNTETGVYIISPYSTDASTRFSYSDLLDQFNIVSPQVWANAIILTTCFWILLTGVKHLYLVARKFARFRMSQDDPLLGQPVYYQVATHMLQTETCDYIRFKERFVSMLMSLFAFFFITLFSCSMTTSKVSRRSFFAFDTYEKILGNKSVQPIWISYSFDHHWYRDAPAGSQQRQLWDQSVRISEEGKAKGEFKPSLITTDTDFVLPLVQRAMDQDFVFFFTSMFADVLLHAACLSIPAVPEIKNLRFKASMDTHLQPSYYVLPVSVHSKETDGMHFLAGVLHEHALFSDPMVRSQIIESFSALAPNKVKRDEKYFECLHYHRFPQDEAETVALVPENFKHLSYLFLASCIVSLVLLPYEKRVCKKRKFKEPIARPKRAPSPLFYKVARRSH